MHAIWAFVLGAGTVLLVVAALSRIVTMPEAPKVITNASEALSRLFNGAFGL